jgi:hypothetical protein
MWTHCTLHKSKNTVGHVLDTLMFLLHPHGNNARFTRSVPYILFFLVDAIFTKGQGESTILPPGGTKDAQGAQGDKERAKKTAHHPSCFFALSLMQQIERASFAFSHQVVRDRFPPDLKSPSGSCQVSTDISTVFTPWTNIVNERGEKFIDRGEWGTNNFILLINSELNACIHRKRTWKWLKCYTILISEHFSAGSFGRRNKRLWLRHPAAEYYPLIFWVVSVVGKIWRWNLLRC